MSTHPHQLYATLFTEADQARLVGFSCGDAMWSRHVGEWILGSDVLDSMKKGTRVWLFETVDGVVVGFGSLGITRRRWPPPSGDYTKVALIPMLGIAEQFHGQPPDPEWRYSKQIMGHLIGEAQELAIATGGPTWLVLHVHQENLRAIRFYQQCGFELILGVVGQNNHLVMKLWIGE